MKNILMIIPSERFRDEELFETKEELEKLGHKISIASTHIGKCPGSRGGFAYSDFDINEIDTDIYDSVIFVGGGGSKLLFNNENAINIAKEMNNKKKIVAAICLAPVILANAGILKDKKATVAGTEANTIENKGAKYTGPGVTVDGNVVTANAPKSSRLFGQTIGKLLIDKND
jgi:protease I